MLYTRQQLTLILVLAAALIAGLGVREWRAGFPDLAERVERFDREEPLPAPPARADGRALGASKLAVAITGDDRAPGATARAAAPPGAGETPGSASPARWAAGPRGLAPVGASSRPGPEVSRADAPPAEAQRGSPLPSAAEAPVDINRATMAELARLPGVGPGLAARILAERERRGRFDSPEALRYVLGMGPKKLAAIRELVTVGE